MTSKMAISHLLHIILNVKFFNPIIVFKLPMVQYYYMTAYAY